MTVSQALEKLSAYEKLMFTLQPRLRPDVLRWGHRGP